MRLLQQLVHGAVPAAMRRWISRACSYAFAAPARSVGGSLGPRTPRNWSMQPIAQSALSREARMGLPPAADHPSITPGFRADTRLAGG